jgi:hypothetical protein
VLNEGASIKVSFEKVTTLDFAVLQLLASFQKTCVASKINVLFDCRGLSAGIADIIEKGGFTGILNIGNTGPHT